MTVGELAKTLSLEIQAVSEEEREKLRYLQPKRRGGQPTRICISFAPIE